MRGRLTFSAFHRLESARFGKSFVYASYRGLHIYFQAFGKKAAVYFALFQVRIIHFFLLFNSANTELFDSEYHGNIIAQIAVNFKYSARNFFEQCSKIV